MKEAICISSEQSETTISTYDVASAEEPQELRTVTLDGNYQCSYQDGETVYVYTLRKAGQGTKIQSYQFMDDSLQSVSSADCDLSLDNIIAINGNDSKLEILGAQKDGVQLQQYDQQMRLVNEKKNTLGEQVFLNLELDKWM